jgi:PTH2 family peptidyl-tRNA hydrolase
MKQIIVMRTDLNMRKGKMIAQGAHAALAVLLGKDIELGSIPNNMSCSEKVRQWLAEGMPKICVRVDSEADLESIVIEARSNNLAAYTVTDAGLTEFHGEPTVTCAAIGPDENEKIDHVTKHLTLL